MKPPLTPHHRLCFRTWRDIPTSTTSRPSKRASSSSSSCVGRKKTEETWWLFGEGRRETFLRTHAHTKAQAHGQRTISRGRDVSDGVAVDVAVALIFRL